jgi:uncharacterized membrane protein
LTDTPDFQSLDDAAAENARLRAQLLAENEKLRAALAANAADSLTFQGLTDEDVRRLEHPEEFVIGNDELQARLAELESALGRADKAVEAAPVEVGESFTDNHDGTWTRGSDGARGTFTPDGFVTS